MSDSSQIRPQQYSIKYKAYGTSEISSASKKRSPSEHVKESLDPPLPYKDGTIRSKPCIIERHNFTDQPYQLVSSVPEDEPLFQPFPPEIHFSCYEPFKKYTKTLQLRNNDKVMRRVQVLSSDPEILHVQPFTSQGSKLYTDIGSSKVACGMEVTYTVIFSPESQEYYKSELLVITDREKFIIPVRCFGPKAVLSFPDEINFPATPVKYSHKKNMIIHNMGNKKAIVMLKTNGAFAVSPSEGAIEAGCFFQCVLEFLPSAIGSHDGELELLDSENGECLFSKLIGCGSELNVGLSSNLVSAVPTFISRSSQMHIRIINESSAVAHFIWPKFATHTDMTEYQGRAGSLTINLDWQYPKIVIEEYGSDLLTHTDVNSNISFQSIMEKAFSIVPTQGEIWPGGSIDIMIMFSPQKPLKYMCVADCIVSGKSEPLKLQLEGLGIGPQVCFFPNLLDLGDLKLFSVLNLTVKVKNTGELEVR